jgi:CheY-like chemotaxis protein
MQSATTHRKVLALDDDASVLTSIEHVLRHLECEPLATSGWTEALDLIEHERPDLVLLDLNMPTVDGSSLLAFLRDSGNQVPVIVVSAWITPEVQRELAIYDVAGFIAKPFDVSGLQEAINGVLGPVPSDEVELPAEPAPPSAEPALADLWSADLPAPGPAGVAPEAASPVAVPVARRGSDRYRRRRGSSRWKRRRTLLTLGGLTAASFVVAVLLGLASWFAGKLDVDALKANVMMSVIKSETGYEARYGGDGLGD